MVWSELNCTPGKQGGGGGMRGEWADLYTRDIARDFKVVCAGSRGVSCE